ncbi:MAG: hypothetical protein LBC68_03285 [Prevotellaceae bacterium]|jgi:5-methylcytosine-specific restriction endonuclease McrA|nr:hypothetical protein [Prevotellaceae bacterium]
METLQVIENACKLILNNQKEQAKVIINENYKHRIGKNDTRSMSNYDRLKIFIRDGFIDRYTGQKLLFPNVLRILSIELGDVFPFHPNWKMSDCHIAFWEFYPTCDHVKPIARGGENVPENIVTTSMKMNSAKSNFLMEELGLKLYEKGNIKNWDGMIEWYIKYVKNNQTILENNYIAGWHTALTKYFGNK